MFRAGWREAPIDLRDLEALDPTDDIELDPTEPNELFLAKSFA
jgi:hypothetical protein